MFGELSKDYIKGLTLTGGDPLYEKNLNSVFDIVVKFRNLYKNKKDIWLYTGYTWEDIFNNEHHKMRRKIIEQCDVMVDGRYVDKLQDISLEFRGSSNQRLIDIQKSINNKNVTAYKL